MQLHRILALAAVAFMGSVRALDFSDAQADSGDDDRDLNLTPNDEDRIYGGSEADAEKYPFIVSLRKTAEGSTYCGGTLIHPQYIVTAAHCVKNTTYASIGSRYSRGSSEGERILVTETFVHPKYVKETHRFDVAVMKLEKPSTYKTIGLAKADGSQNKDNSMAVVRGWGMTESDVAAATMLEVNVKIVSNAVCNKSYNNRITAEMLCAGEGGGKDSCQGDSGGPLISNNVLVGIVSWGGACGEAPGVYVRVSNVLDFINEKVGGGAAPAVSSAAPTSSAPAPSSAVPSVTPSVTPSPMPSSSAPEAVTETPVPSAADASETPAPSDETTEDATETPVPSDETTDDASEAPSASDETTDDSSSNESGDSVGDDKEDNESDKVPSPVPSSSPAGKGGKGDVPAPVPASPDAGKGGKGDVPAPVPSSSDAGKGGKGDVPAPAPSANAGKGGKGDVPAPVPSSSDAGKGGKSDVPAPAPSADAGKGGKGDVPTPGSSDSGNGSDVTTPAPKSSKPKKKDCSARL